MCVLFNLSRTTHPVISCRSWVRFSIIFNHSRKHTRKHHILILMECWRMHPIINQFSRVVCLPPVFFSLSARSSQPKVHNINIKIQAACFFFGNRFGRSTTNHQRKTTIKPAITVIAVNVSYPALCHAPQNCIFEVHEMRL